MLIVVASCMLSCTIILHLNTLHYYIGECLRIFKLLLRYFFLQLLDFLNNGNK